MLCKNFFSTMTRIHSPYRPIVAAAIKKTGGLGRWARRFGVHRSTIHDWTTQGAVPADRAVIIERESFHMATRQELRPGDYWEWWPDLPSPSNETATVVPELRHIAARHGCSCHELQSAIEALLVVYKQHMKNTRRALDGSPDDDDARVGCMIGTAK